ncbi:DUF1758 domain-containing protein [Trichonephila clavipes]|nr:DUF1758 domain-containing protein [Trichonephila clavipes]
MRNKLSHTVKTDNKMAVNSEYLMLSSSKMQLVIYDPLTFMASTLSSNIWRPRQDVLLESELKNDVVDLQKISLLQVQLKDKYLRLEAAQEAVSGALLQLEDNGEEFETDFIDAESYREKYLEYYTRIDKKLGETVISDVPDTPRKFKLPKLELRKFGGDPKEFLSFWSQFQKIHDDGSIPDEDKMQYLVASVEPKAERLILSFPATAANYPKAVDQLKERFGRDDLLVQIYVRDLLTMVVKNDVSGRKKKRTFQDSMTSWREI